MQDTKNNQPSVDIPPDFNSRLSSDILRLLNNSSKVSEVQQPEYLKHIYIPTWDNKPEQKAPVLTLGGTSILNHQNTSALIARPGAGKTSQFEAIAASLLNPHCDCLGYAVSLTCAGIIIADTERTDTDVWNSLSRTAKRAGLKYRDPLNNISFIGMRSLARAQYRREALIYQLERKECDLLLIDGAGDLVDDINDLHQAVECRMWLREITVKYGVSVFSTIHPNPGSDKPRGHLGSEICRESECVLLTKPFDGEARIITSDFEHGKNRNNPKLTAGYTWSDEHKMFVSTDCNVIIAGKQVKKEANRRGQLERLVKELLPPPTAMRHTELVAAYMEKTGDSIPTAKRKIKAMVDFDIIKKSDDEHYRAIV